MYVSSTSNILIIATANAILATSHTPSSQPLQEAHPNESLPMGIDLMDASFYLGQDIVNEPNHSQFAGSTNFVDFYERYWDNLMLLGTDPPFSGIGINDEAEVEN